MKVTKIVRVRKASKENFAAEEKDIKISSALENADVKKFAEKAEEKPKETPKPEKKAEEKPKTIFIEEINVKKSSDGVEKSSLSAAQETAKSEKIPQKKPNNVQVISDAPKPAKEKKKEMPEIVLSREEFREVNETAQPKKAEPEAVKKTTTKAMSREKINELYSDKDIEQVETVEIDDVNNMALGKNGTLLIKYIGTNEVIHIPDTITSIGKYAFRGNKSAKTIIMSDSVKTVDRFAFAHCVNLEEIVFSRNLESIGENAFLKCQRLKELDLPNSLKNIGKGAFGRCSSIRKLIFPGQIKRINDLSFFACRNLNRVIISHSVEAIGNAAFSECYGLKKIVIADSVTSIGESAFSWCRSLEEITIPSSVKTVGSWAFYGCTKLTDVRISVQTKDVRDDAFCGCENIYNVKIAEFEGVDYNQTTVKKGQKLILRILKQVNRKKAERYAREHNISTMFM